MKKYSIGYLGTDQYLHDVRMAIVRYGNSYSMSGLYVEPLDHYIRTGRASATFLRKLTETKPFRVARVLLKSGAATADYNVVMRQIYDLIGYEFYECRSSY